LTCQSGTIITLRKDIFNTKNTSTPITIKVKEYYTKNEFVLSNLTTQDVDKKQLESRGMINIEAFQGDKKLELNSGESIDILFKDRELNDETQTFNGITLNEDIIWENSSPASFSLYTHDYFAMLTETK
jgi:hypothetical protein